VDQYGFDQQTQLLVERLVILFSAVGLPPLETAASSQSQLVSLLAVPAAPSAWSSVQEPWVKEAMSSFVREKLSTALLRVV